MASTSWIKLVEQCKKMAADTNALKLRRDAKKRKPLFIEKESKFTAGVKKRWRFPRGKHSKVRQMHKGRPALPNPGYGSPKSVRGLDRSGLEPVVVRRVEDLEGLDAGKHGIVISRTCGARKKMDVLKSVQAKKLSLLNIKDASAALSAMESLMAERKKVRAARMSAKAKKVEDKKKQAAAKKEAEAKEEKTESVEDKVAKEDAKKKEAEKTMTKRQ
ncbi:hypothetical protein CL620_04340 [archaeon]|jgi:large subunit ribosomal protein L32e|nr:hypothetical protein [archaeon]